MTDDMSIHEEALREAWDEAFETAETGAAALETTVEAAIRAYLTALSRHGLKVTGPEATEGMCRAVFVYAAHGGNGTADAWRSLHAAAPPWPPED